MLPATVDPMSTDLAPAAATPSITLEQGVAIRAALDAALAPGTQVAYASSWRTWSTWCEAHGHQPMPAHPLSLAAWVTERATALSVSTITKDLAAVRAAHEAAGVDDPTAGRDLRLVMKGLRRTYGVAPRKQAHPVTTAELRRVLGAIDRKTLRGKRDAAILLTGYAGALRRGELAALRVGDVAFAAAGAVITLRRSKSDQEGQGAVVGIVRGQHSETDPVSALREWLRAADVSGEDALFQRIAPGARKAMGRGMSGQSIATVLTARANAAGLDDLPISGHSLRAGHATQASEAGVAATRIARTTRHARLETLAKYVRPAEALADSTSSELGL